MTHQSTTVENLPGLADLSLPFSPSTAMDFKEPLIKMVDQRLLVGYLVDDHYIASSPLDDEDGLGKILSSHRHSDTHSEMQEALGLNREWEPDLDLACEADPTIARKYWVNAAVKSEEFHSWVTETSGPGASFSDSYYRRRALRYWNEGGWNGAGYSMDLNDFSFTDEALLNAWIHCRSAGLIGEVDSVMLDCYEHSGIAWSISGEGHQCRFDTARGAGVWIPDECADEEIIRRAQVYQFGRIVEHASKYYVAFDQVPQERMTPFEHWHEAFLWMQAEVTDSKAFRLPKGKQQASLAQRKGRERAAEEIAREAIRIYNEWANGHVYGIAITEFEQCHSCGSWDEVDGESVWNYVGTDNAYDALREAFIGRIPGESEGSAGQSSEGTLQ